MELKRILDGIDFEVISGNVDEDINGVQYDNRKIQSGEVFVAVRGFKTDGHKYIKGAIENGAAAIIAEEKPEDCNIDNVTFIITKDTRKALAKCGANFYGNPAKQLKLIGVTGTNGKTTSTFMLKGILEKAGHKTGVIGTIANYIGDKALHTNNTTPESLDLHKLFRQMVDEGIEYCVMEVSSHSLALSRVYGLEFRSAIFTNLTQDHMDFHKTFENYFMAKAKLFTMTHNAIINIDDEYGLRLKAMVEGQGDKVHTFSLKNMKDADIYSTEIDASSRGVKYAVQYKDNNYQGSLIMPGEFNVYNSMGCILACLLEGISMDTIIEALSDVTVPGRSQLVSHKLGVDYDVFLDYSHTPDSLKNALENAREFTENRLICVFGCGGDRDTTKRPIMGHIGTELSDIAIITSDNPRTEEPMAIIDEIVKGTEKDNYEVIENRRDAIKRALEIAQKGDVIVIAGKGHETYQVLKDKTIDFDEKKIVRDLVKELKG